MITKQTLYGCTCDGCGKKWDDTQYGHIPDKGFIEAHLIYSGWITRGDKHYCSKCKEDIYSKSEYCQCPDSEYSYNTLGFCNTCGRLIKEK